MILTYRGRSIDSRNYNHSGNEETIVNPQPIAAESIDGRTEDYNDPAFLAAECAALAEGMEQQANAARSGTALSGHPHPNYFYGKVAHTLRAAAQMVKGLVPEPKPKTEAAKVDAPKTDEKGKK